MMPSPTDTAVRRPGGELVDRVGVTAAAITATSLRIDTDALLVVYVLRGAVHVRVGSEDFDLAAGDFVVVNRADPYALVGSKDNVTAIVSLRLQDFDDVDAYCTSMIFACESFDLARYRRQEGVLRALLVEIVELGVTADDPERLDARAADLVALLCTGYSLEHYYNRGRELSNAQRHRLHAILASMREHLRRRDALDAVAAAHHYSKSYVSHVVKELCGISFGDHLTGLRVMHAETLLLTTDMTSTEIAAACGFSHVKYLTRGFQDWFGQSPSEFRARYRPDMVRDDILTAVPAPVVLDLLVAQRSHEDVHGEPPRPTVTPLLLKHARQRVALFDELGTFDGTPAPASTERLRVPEPARRHLVPIRVDPDDVGAGRLLDGLASFVSIGAVPCLVVAFAGTAATLRVVEQLAARLPEAAVTGTVVWLTYPGLHARAAVDRIVEIADERHGLTVQAILVA